MRKMAKLNNVDSIEDTYSKFIQKIQYNTIDDEVVFTNEIYVDTDAMDDISLAADELTVSADNADIPESNEIKKKRKKIESKISQLIEMFELSKYQKSVLPSASKRNTSRNLCKDNQLRYSWMVHLGHKLINGVQQSLSPGPSRSLLQKDILKKIQKEGEVSDALNENCLYFSLEYVCYSA